MNFSDNNGHTPGTRDWCGACASCGKCVANISSVVKPGPWCAAVKVAVVLDISCSWVQQYLQVYNKHGCFDYGRGDRHNNILLAGCTTIRLNVQNITVDVRHRVNLLFMKRG